MTCELQFKPDSQSWHLCGELTIYSVTSAYTCFLQARSEAKPLMLNVSGLSEIDGAGLQLLLWTQLQQAQIVLVGVEQSEALVNLSRQLKLNLDQLMSPRLQE